MGVRTFPTPEELQSYRFPKNTGPNPLKNHKAIPAKIHTQVRREAIDDDDDDDDDDHHHRPANETLRWQADDGPLFSYTIYTAFSKECMRSTWISSPSLLCEIQMSRDM